MTYRLRARQAQEVKLAREFIDAFNSRRLRDALRVLEPHAVANDCDYRRVRDVEFEGTREIQRWLRGRFADHDYLGVRDVFNENPDQPVGVLGVAYSVRRSRTLARLGFPAGITQNLGTKVRFSSRAPIRIAAFANGPGPIGVAKECKPQ